MHCIRRKADVNAEHWQSNSKTFIYFVELVMEHFASKYNLRQREIAVIWDNWSVHWASEFQRYWEKAGLILWYLPPYSPELVSIEVHFSNLKKEIISRIGWKQIDLNDKDAVESIWAAIQSFGH